MPTQRRVFLALSLCTLLPSAAAVTFTRDQVRVELPDGWRDTSESDVSAFENPAYLQQLVVGEYRFREKLPREAAQVLHRQYTGLRRDTEVEFFQGQATISEPTYGVKGNVPTSSYTGARAASGTRFRTVLLLLESGLLSLRYESRHPTEPQFERAAEAILSGVSIRHVQ